MRTRTKVLVFVGFAGVSMLAALFAYGRHVEQRLEEARKDYERTIGPLDLNAYRIERKGPSDLQATLGLVRLDRADMDIIGNADGQARDAEATPDAADVSRVLEANGTVIEAARTASRDDIDWWLYPAIETASPDLDPLLQVLKLAQLLRVAAAERLVAGDLDAAADLGDALLKLARATEEQPLFVASLIATNVRGHGLLTVRRLVGDPRCQRECLARLDRILLRKPPAEAGRALAKETAMLIGDTWTDATGESPFPSFFFADREELYLIERLRRLIEDASRPYEDVAEHLTVLDPDRRPRVGKIIADMLIPNLVDGVYKMKRVHIAHDLARVAIACRLEADTTGSLPERLEPGTLLAQAEVRYRLQDDGGARLTAPNIIPSLPADHPKHGTTIEPTLFDWRLPAPVRRSLVSPSY